MGVVITSVTPGSAGDQDGRVKPGDILVSINGCSLLDAEPRQVGEILRSADKATSDVVVQYIPADTSFTEISPKNSFRQLQRPHAKSDEEEDEYFDVSEPEPPELPPYTPSTLVSEIKMPIPFSHASPEAERLRKQTDNKILPKLLPAETKISPIHLPVKSAAVPVTVSSTSVGSFVKGLDVSSMVSKVKPTVPFKPTRTSLSPKDALPAKAKSKTTTIENLVGDVNTTSMARQWGPECTVELWRDPVKGLGISIICGAKVDALHGGIFIKNVLPDSPAGWNGTLKRGDRILEVSGVDIRIASHAKAVDVIKNASNPVKFLIQSLIPLPKKAESESPSVPSMLPLEVSTDEAKLETTKSPDAKTSTLTSFQLSPVSPTAHSPSTPSASSSNSSSRESTIKRNSSCKEPVAPREIIASAPAAVTPSDEGTANANDLPCEKDEADDKLAFGPLEEGKVLTKQGLQIDSASAGNIKLTPTEKAGDLEEEDE
ncbi:Multiple PDZ domain protein, partial [Stegodyphus mimosarum]